MPSGITYNFFASREDELNLWRWLETQPGMRFVVYGSHADPDNRIRSRFPEDEWRTAPDFRAAAWPSLVGGLPRPYRPGASSLTSAAFIYVFRPLQLREHYIGPYGLMYHTEKSVRILKEFTEGDIQQVDWSAFRVAVLKIQKHLKSAAVAKWNTKPVLPGAASELRDTGKLLWFWGQEGTI